MDEGTKVWTINGKVTVSGKSGGTRITVTVYGTIYLDPSCLVTTKAVTTKVVTTKVVRTNLEFLLKKVLVQTLFKAMLL
jgi:hypothetical protein